MKPERQFAELLPWMFTYGEDNLVVNKDGSLTAFFSIAGTDIDGTSSEELGYFLHTLDQAYEVFRDASCVFTWLVHRRACKPYPEAVFPDEYSALVDSQRKAQYEQGGNFYNQHYLAVSLLADGKMAGWMARINFYLENGLGVWRALGHTLATLFRGNDAFTYSAEELSGRTEKFNSLLKRFVERIAGLGPHQLAGDNLRGVLRRCVNPTSTQDAVVAMPFLDQHIPNAELVVEHDCLVFDGTTYMVGVSLKEPPRLTFQGLFDQLLAVEGEMVFSQNFRFANKKQIESHLSSVRQYNDLLKYSPVTWLYLAFNRHADVRANDARLEAAESAHQVHNRVEMNDAYYGWYAAQCLVMGNSLYAAEQVLHQVTATLEGNNLTAIREKIHLLSAFAGGIAGMHAMQKRWFMLELPSLADLSPIRTVDSGYQQNTYLTEQRGKHSPALMVLDTAHHTPYYFNLHVGDLGHALVIGPSRSGKSSGMNIIIAQFRKYAPCRVIIFDKDRSCRIPTLMMGGEHIDVSVGSGNRWNPLSLLSDIEAHEWLSSWVESLICYRDYIYTSEDVKEVWSALQGLSAQDQAHWTLGHLHSILAPHLQCELDVWVGAGALAQYFDHLEDSFNLSELCCIEMGELLQKPHVARAFMDYAFYRIYQMLRRPANGIIPTLVYIEECWFMLENPYFEQKIRDWTKTFAKWLAQLVMATQSLEDIADAKVFSSLRDNIQTRIYLPNQYATSPQMMALYVDQFGLHEDQVTQIAAGIPKCDYFIQQPNVFRKTLMRIDPVSLAIVRSDALAQTTFQRHLDSGHASWRKNYIDDMLNQAKSG